MNIVLIPGFWLDGSWLRPKDDWNAAYYGRAVPAREIVRDHQVVASAEISALHQSLTRF